ncbi:MAG: SpoIIE family protein phosphatase [Bdellovibrionota bacterium]
MEQQQIKVSFSLGTKLLLSVVSLLFFVIFFLDASTILLLTEDKRAYTFQSQSVQAELLGREFVSMARNAFDTLKVTIATVDPAKPVDDARRGQIKSLLDNQSLLLAVSVGLVDGKTGQRSVLVQSIGKAAGADFKPADFELNPEILKPGLPSLTKEGFSFFNLSRMGGPTLIGIAYADLAFKSPDGRIPVAFGFLTLGGFGQQIRSSKVTISDREGRVFFDSDPAVLFTTKSISDFSLFEAAANSTVANGTREYEAEDGVRYLGSFVQPGLNLVVMAKTEWRKAMRATFAMIEKFVLLGLMAIGFACIFAVFFAKTLTNPLLKLYDATREVAAGNFNLNLEQKGRDEIGALTGSFNVMSQKINELIVESMEKVRLENELSIASTVQQTLFPPSDFRDENVKIKGFYQSASECGGDWWGYFGVNRKLSLMIADATGHGLPSALITAAARSCFSVMYKLAQDDPAFTFSPSAMLAYANRVVNEAANGKIMMTFFCGVMDFDTMTFSYSSAGHNPPWLFKNSGGQFSQKSMVALGQRLGESHEVNDFEEKKVDIGKGDILFLYTDGLMEGKNAEGTMYGKKRVKKVLEGSLASGPEGMIEALVADFKQHNGEKPLDDDITLSTIEILTAGHGGGGGGG